MPESLDIENVSVDFPRNGSVLHAVREVSLRVDAGECVGVVGESGSGKTQLFMSAMGLLPRNAVRRGRILFGGRDLATLPRSALDEIRGARLSMIFQDSMSALTPHLKVGVQLAEVLVAHAGSSWTEAWSAAGRMLERVHLPEPLRCLAQYPHELSGGMRQRVVIAMSLMCGPAMLIADEPTTALDVTLQGQLLRLLADMRRESGMSLVFISHDLHLMGGLADRVVVMYAGRVVESGGTRQMFDAPRHPYTAELLRCTPRLGSPQPGRLPTIPGHPPAADATPPGCAFAPRCRRAAERCSVERPELVQSAGTAAACHFPLHA
jgi:oligopeptide transport system ATP-binding protein